jgi:Flp pilus assembly pilin Flp
MQRPVQKLMADRRGSTAAEFALVIPVFVLAFFACFQVAVVYFANAGLQNAVGEGARMATLWPRKTEAQIAAQIDATQFGLKSGGLAPPAFVYGTAGGQDYVEITMTYTTEMNLAFMQVPGITLTQTRRAYLP